MQKRDKDVPWTPLNVRSVHTRQARTYICTSIHDKHTYPRHAPICMPAYTEKEDRERERGVYGEVEKRKWIEE